MNADTLDKSKNVDWKNPLSIKDDGTGDETVLTQSDGSIIILRRYRPGMIAQHPAQPLRDDIYDADGDGIEDIQHIPHEDLDKFYIPYVYKYAEDLHNTRHGHLPGFNRKRELYTEPSEEYYNHYSDGSHTGLASLADPYEVYRV